MTESLRRQKILLERELIKLINNGKYVKTENGYGLREQPVSQEELCNKTKEAIIKNIDKYFANLNPQDSKSVIRESIPGFDFIW